MSVPNIVPSGSHQASLRGRKTPAQNSNAYAALKLSGNSPGHRVTANTAMSSTASQRLDFSFTGAMIRPVQTMARRARAAGKTGSRVGSAQESAAWTEAGLYGVRRLVGALMLADLSASRGASSAQCP